MSDEEVEISRITITRTLSDDGDLVRYWGVDGQGDRLAVVEALGLLRMAEDTVLHGPETEDEDDE